MPLSTNWAWTSWMPNSRLSRSPSSGSSEEFGPRRGSEPVFDPTVPRQKTTAGNAAAAQA